MRRLGLVVRHCHGAVTSSTRPLPSFTSTINALVPNESLFVVDAMAKFEFLHLRRVNCFRCLGSGEL